MIKSNAVLENIHTRRAIRKYRHEQISSEELDAILTAGLYAPIAGGRQYLQFVVSQNREVNETLGKINCICFGGKPAPGNVSYDQPSINDDPQLRDAFYGAPTVITLFDKNPMYSAINCGVAAQNMMLAAHSLGIGSCLIGRAGETLATKDGQAILAVWGMEEGYQAICHVVLGYLQGSHPAAKPRKEGRIKFVE